IRAQERVVPHIEPLRVRRLERVVRILLAARQGLDLRAGQPDPKPLPGRVDSPMSPGRNDQGWTGTGLTTPPVPEQAVERHRPALRPRAVVAESQLEPVTDRAFCR